MKIVRFSVLIMTALFLTACRQSIDLSSIIALSKATSDSQVTFAALSDDFFQSCLRTASWQRAAEPQVSRNALSTCAEEAKAANQWQAANSVVTGYVASLGALAGGGSDPGDYGLGNFAQTVAQLGPTKAFTGTQQQAVVSVTKSLLTDYFNIKRRQALSSIIPQADSDLDTLINTLEDAGRTNYVTQLTSERIAITLFFEPNISRAAPGVQRLIAFNYRATERNELHAVDQRQAAVANYVAALEQIRTTHHKIADAISNDHLGDVAGIVSAYVSEYQPQLIAIQKAFK